MITRLHSLSHHFSQLFYITHTMTGYRSLLYKLVTFSPPFIITREIICLQHFYNKFQVAGCYWLLLLGQKSNLSVSFKFEPITINHL